MLVKDILEVMNEDRVEENFVLYWSWILHNFIHSMNTSRVPALRCVVTVGGKKHPAIRYIQQNGDYCTPMYCLTDPHRSRDLREYCKKRPMLKLSFSANAYTHVPEDSLRRLFGIAPLGWFPCDQGFLSMSYPLSTERRFPRPEHPWEESEVTCTFDAGIAKLPNTAEGFDNEAFEGYLAGEECSLSRMDLKPHNAVYFRTDPVRFMSGTPAELNRNPIHWGLHGYEDDDMSNVLIIK